MKRIVYTNADGGLEIVLPVINTHPVPEKITEQQALDRALSKLPENIKLVTILEPEQFPTDRTHRDLWVLNSDKTAVVVDPVRLSERLRMSYKEKRASEYPTVSDQLDTLFHGGFDAWKAQIQSIKDKHPKPE